MSGDAPAVTTAQPDTGVADSAPAAVTDPVASAADAPSGQKPGDQPGDQPDGAKAGEGDQTNPGTYTDFTMPEGMELDTALLGKAAPLFQKYGVSKEDAQAFVDLYAGEIQAGSQRQVDAFNQLMTDWRDQASTDKEFGGDRFEESVKTARLAVDKFGSPELKQLLEEHGVGNHPEFIRLMYRVGKLIKEDTPGSTPRAPSAEKSRLEILYPSEKSA